MAQEESWRRGSGGAQCAILLHCSQACTVLRLVLPNLVGCCGCCQRVEAWTVYRQTSGIQSLPPYVNGRCTISNISVWPFVGHDPDIWFSMSACACGGMRSGTLFYSCTANSHGWPRSILRHIACLSYAGHHFASQV